MGRLIDSERIDCLCSGRHCSLASPCQRRLDIGKQINSRASLSLQVTSLFSAAWQVGFLATLHQPVQSRFHAKQSCQLSESVGVGESPQISLGHQGTIRAERKSQSDLWSRADRRQLSAVSVSICRQSE